MQSIKTGAGLDTRIWLTRNPSSSLVPTDDRLAGLRDEVKRHKTSTSLCNPQKKGNLKRHE
ncbi:hypothetical protein SBA6_1230023 [Candidatus Sulfopaludibacter sp. SbA6]|nr:hypothetical protein SBA6_1230023 [Candidatus Sulfopaludibacter sp. SbA6]